MLVALVNSCSSGAICVPCRARYKQEAYPAYGRFEALGGLAGLGDVEHVLTATRL